MTSLNPSDFVYAIDPEADFSWYPKRSTENMYSIFMSTRAHAEKRGCLSDQPDDRPKIFFPVSWRAHQEETNQWYVNFPGTQMELIEQLEKIGFSTNIEFDKFLSGVSAQSPEFQAHLQKKRLNDALNHITQAAKKSKM